MSSFLFVWLLFPFSAGDETQGLRHTRQYSTTELQPQSLQDKWVSLVFKISEMSGFYSYALFIIRINQKITFSVSFIYIRILSDRKLW